MSRQLLILDLDETLVYATEDANQLPRTDFTVGPFSVLKRPYLDEFLAQILQWFDVAVWTSSSSAYALPVVAALFPSPAVLKFTWCHDRCTRRFDPEMLEHFSLKNLRKVTRLGYRLERILMLDDSREKLQRNYGNHIRISEFTGDLADIELRDLLPYLDWIRTAPNVRTIEKRDWRQKIAILRAGGS